MNELRELVDEYDRLGDVQLSSAHDFTSRQRHLESWAARARNAIVDLISRNASSDIKPQPAAGNDPGGAERADS